MDDCYVWPATTTGAISHTDETPFCWEKDCPCRDNEEAIHQLKQYHQDGLVSGADYIRIYTGRTI